MRYSEISSLLGKYFLYLAGILLLPLGISIYYDFFHKEESFLRISATMGFLGTIGICLILSILLSFFAKGVSKGSLHRKESILLVILVWFLTAAVGALPFLFTRAMTNPIDAYFESMAGLTTTGSTIIQPKAYSPTGQEVPITLQNPLNTTVSYTFYGTVAPARDPNGLIVHEGIEALGKPLLFWRSFLQWFGGIGVIVLFITVLPALGMGGKFLYESEASSLTREGITPRIKETGIFLLKIYFGLTLLQILLLIASNVKMPIFDAVTLAFSTISTGGFTIYNDGLTQYHLSPMGWIVISLFMIFGGLNFSLYFHCIKRKIYRLYDQELIFYLLLFILGSLCLAVSLWKTPFFSLKEASFEAISTQTSTGFSSVNYDNWPLISQLILIALMFIGGMSGSTAGGVKVIRIIILVRIICYKIESLFRPEVVRVLKVGNKEIPDKAALTVLTFFCLVILSVCLGVFLLILDKNDPITSLGIISSCITNAGLNFGGIGATASLGFLSNFSKIVAILWMVLGRLEFFSLLVLFVPAFWRSR